MRLLLLGALIALPASAASTPAPAPVGNMPVIDPIASDDAGCPPISRYHAAKRQGKLTAQKLTELPVADVYLAVERRIGRCQAPIIVRYGLGAEQR